MYLVHYKNTLTKVLEYKDFEIKRRDLEIRIRYMDIHHKNNEGTICYHTIRVNGPNNIEIKLYGITEEKFNAITIILKDNCE